MYILFVVATIPKRPFPSTVVDTDLGGFSTGGLQQANVYEDSRKRSRSSAGDGDGDNEGENGPGHKRSKKNPTAERSNSDEEHGLPGKQATPIQSGNTSGRRTSGRQWKPTIKATEATLAVARKKNPVVLLLGKAFPKITASKKAALKNLTLLNNNGEEGSKRTTRSRNHNLGSRYATAGNGAQFSEVIQQQVFRVCQLFSNQRREGRQCHNSNIKTTAEFRRRI
jgi:hypothetical protein